jgi:hypothetical protein
MCHVFHVFVQVQVEEGTEVTVLLTVDCKETRYHVVRTHADPHTSRTQIGLQSRHSAKLSTFVLSAGANHWCEECPSHATHNNASHSSFGILSILSSVSCLRVSRVCYRTGGGGSASGRF